MTWSGGAAGGEGRFSGKVAFVTGANRRGNIGSSIAFALAREGACVVMSGRGRDELEKAAADLLHRGMEAYPCVCDVCDEAAVAEAVGEAVARYGRLDLLVNNAAVVGCEEDGAIADLDAHTWDTIMDTNVRGAFLMTRQAIPAMISSGGGAIVNVSSQAARVGNDRYTAYACSKAALNTLTVYTATQYGRRGIRCNALSLGVVRTNQSGGHVSLGAVCTDGNRGHVSLGVVRTNENRSHTEEEVGAFGELSPLGRNGLPVDVARATLFLLSDEAAWLTGQIVPLDGGLLAQAPRPANPIG